MMKGKYYSSLKQYINAGGNKTDIINKPCIHKSGSISGMRKLFWGYNCDVVSDPVNLGRKFISKED